MANLNDTAPGHTFAALATSDSANLTLSARALWVGTSGNIAVVGTDGAVATFKNVPSGTLLPINAIRVNATNTTASDIVAIY